MEDLIQLVTKDYTLGRDIDGSTPDQPDRAVVIGLVEKLRQLVFPGYFGGAGETVIREVVEGLSGQIGRVMPLENGETHALSRLFLLTLPAVRELVQTDLQAAFDGDPAAHSKGEIILSYPGLYAITVYRLAHELQRLGIPMLPRIMTEYAHSVTGIDIHPGAAIGRYFFIDHGTGVVIGETTEIGHHVKLYQGVTLGGLSTQGGQRLRGVKRHPTIGDGVTVYANATILGGDTLIGRHCVIGANAFITASVPPCTTVSMKDRELLYKPHRCPDDMVPQEIAPNPRQGDV